MNSKNKGFTLIELLVVLVVIGVIAALILPNTLKAIGQANDKECLSNIRAINTAAQMCYTQERDWTQCNSLVQLTTVPAQQTQPYLDQTPVCPFGVAYTINGGATRGDAVSVNPVAHFVNFPPLSGEFHVGNTN